MAAVADLARSRRLMAVVAVAAGALVLLASLLGLFWAVEHGRIGLADAGTALFALLILAQRLRALVTNAGILYEASLFLDDTEELEAYLPDGARSAAAVEPLAPFEELRAEGLTFRYPGAPTPAVQDVDLVIRRGETVALVGENGSGKTTLAKVLTGLAPPTGGRLWWDDQDAAALNPAQLRRSASVVFQDFGRFQLSVADNVALGSDEEDRHPQALAAAAEEAGATAVIDALPRGWDHPLGRLEPDGAELSVGQWQRLALARALYRQAPFLVMDEPSAALDPRAEQALFDRLQEIAAGRSVLFISHRFSTVRQADRIYVMEAGRVVEEGSHDELMAREGHYADMYRLQAAMFR